MKRVGLLTTLFLFTLSLSIYSHNLPITFTALRNHTVDLFKASPKVIQKGLQRSLPNVLEKNKLFSLPTMTKNVQE